MQTGIQDAVNLGWKLAQVVDGTSPESLLDSYHAERHPVGARVLQNTMAQVTLGKPDARHRALRDTMAEMLTMDEPRRYIGAMLTGLDVHYDLGGGHPLIGRRMPDLDLHTPSGPSRVFAELHDARPVLLNFGEPGGFDSAAWADRVRPIDAQLDRGAGTSGPRRSRGTGRGADQTRRARRLGGRADGPGASAGTLDLVRRGRFSPLRPGDGRPKALVHTRGIHFHRQVRTSRGSDGGTHVGIVGSHEASRTDTRKGDPPAGVASRGSGRSRRAPGGLQQRPADAWPPHVIGTTDHTGIGNGAIVGRPQCFGECVVLGGAGRPGHRHPGQARRPVRQRVRLHRSGGDGGRGLAMNRATLHRQD